MSLIVEVTVANFTKGMYWSFTESQLSGSYPPDLWYKRLQETIRPVSFMDGDLNIVGRGGSGVFTDDNFCVAMKAIAPTAQLDSGWPHFFNKMDENSLYPGLPDYLGVGCSEDLVMYRDLAYLFFDNNKVDIGDDGAFNLTYYLVYEETPFDDIPAMLGFVDFDKLHSC